MKHLKIYEKFNEPQIGDYVQLKIYGANPIWYNFVNNTIGQIIDIYNDFFDENKKHIKIITVKFNKKDVPDNIKAMSVLTYQKETNSYYRKFRIDKIIKYAPTKEELKVKITADKYNL